MRSQWNSSNASPAIHLPFELPASFRKEWESIASRSDDPLLERELLILAGRMQSTEQRAPALQLFQWLASHSSNPEIQSQARSEADSLLQLGSSGKRFEAALGLIARQASDYRAILPMLAGSAAGQMAEAFAWNRLTNATSLLALGRGVPRGIASMGFALGIEAPVVVAASRCLNDSTETWNQDLPRAALGLGLFKIGGAFARRYLPSHEIAGHGIGLLSQWGLGTIEARLGLRDPNRGGIAESLASYLTMSIGSHLGSSLAGNRFAGRIHPGETRSAARVDPEIFTRLNQGLVPAATGRVSNARLRARGAEATILLSLAGDAAGGPARGILDLPGVQQRMQNLLEVISPSEQTRNAKLEADFLKRSKHASAYLNQGDRIAAAWKFFGLLEAQHPNSDAFIHASAVLLERMAFPDFDGKSSPENDSEIGFRNQVLKRLALVLGKVAIGENGKQRLLQSTFAAYAGSQPEFRYLAGTSAAADLPVEPSTVDELQVPVRVDQAPPERFSYENRVSEKIEVKFSLLGDLHSGFGGSVRTIVVAKPKTELTLAEKRYQDGLKPSLLERVIDFGLAPFRRLTQKK